MTASAAREAAELVREAAAVLADDMTSVGFAISHGQDRTVLFEQILTITDDHAPKHDWNVETTRGRVLWTETLTSTGFGAWTVIVAARTAGYVIGPEGPILEHQASVHAPATVPIMAEEPSVTRTTVFYWSAHPNPTFLYRGMGTLEVLLQPPPSPPGTTQLQAGDALLTARTVHELARAARGTEVPLVLVQTPVAETPSSSDPSADSWPVAQTPGIRCSIALPPDNVQKRLDLVRLVYEIAKARGLALHIGDRRGDSPTGRWHRVLGHDSDSYGEKLRALQCRSSLTRGLPVTFVGTARVGTTEQIMSHLVKHDIAVLSVSVTPLENLAFIHVLIGLTDDHSDPFGPDDDRHGSATAVLRKLEVVGFTTPDRPQAEEAHRTSEGPTGYQACVGEVVPLRPLDDTRHALWAAWRFPEEPGVPQTLMSKLREALVEPMGRDSDETRSWSPRASVQYVICRRGIAGDIRGQCKFAVPREFQVAAGKEERGHRRTELCRRIEERWRTLLATVAPRSAYDVEVTWDESRLRRWLSPPGGARAVPAPKDDLREEPTPTVWSPSAADAPEANSPPSDDDHIDPA